MPLTILKYGDCTSYNGRIRENVGYRGVGLERFHCTSYTLDTTTSFVVLFSLLNSVLGCWSS